VVKNKESADKNGFIFDKNEGYWAGQRDPSPSPESQRVLERSDFLLRKTELFLTRTRRVCKVEDYLLCIKRDV
jgi:hypothetical protein